ncbi:MAG: hypothetical protein ACT4OK_17370 [Gemmobacter sp.]
MTDDSTNRPTGEDHPVPPKTPAKPLTPRKGFDPATLKGGQHPGGKMVRGTRNMQSAKSRGRG